jgi:hypothetical protein
MTLNTSPQPTTYLPTCAPLSPIPSPLPSARLHWRPLVPCAGSEPLLRWKRTRMTRIGRIFTDFPIRVNPCHPCNLCSTAASLLAGAPGIRNANYLQFTQTTNLRSSAVRFLRKRRIVRVQTGLTGWTG